MVDHILVDRSDPVCVVVTLNKPAKRNALNLAMWRDLASTFAQLAVDEAARAVILTGAGGCFSAGADISEFAESRTGKKAGEAYEAAVHNCYRGIETLAQADYRRDKRFLYRRRLLAWPRSATFGSPTTAPRLPCHPPGLGIVYGRDHCRTLLALVGLAKAKEILFTAKRFAVAEAVACGFVDRVAANGKGALASAVEFARQMAANAPLSIEGMKLILNTLAGGAGDDERIDAMIANAMESADYKEAVQAFAEKRQPVFRGR